MSQDVVHPSSAANVAKNKAQGAEGETRGCSFFGSGSACCLVVGKSRCTVLSGMSVLVTNYISCSVPIRASKCMRTCSCCVYGNSMQTLPPYP